MSIAIVNTLVLELFELARNHVLRVAVLVLILASTVVFDRLLSRILRGLMKKHSVFLNVDHTQFVVFRHIITAVIYLVGIGIVVYLIPPLRALSVSLLAGAGVFAIVVGFASQKAFSNLISGIFIAIFKPFRVGDLIKFKEHLGTVEDITLRHTVLRNFENKRFVVPNSTISDEVIENYTIADEKICAFVDMSISYDSDIDQAMRIMSTEILKHPEFIDTRSDEEKKKKEPALTVRVISFGDSSVNLRAWAWAKGPGAAFRMKCDLNKSIKNVLMLPELKFLSHTALLL